MSTSFNCHSEVRRVNDVRLQVLDWGGDGPALIFLAGYANTPHFFDSLAPAFTDRFHVLGLTRRAHGESQQPESGYDLATLASDILGIMDALSVNRAILVGHSFAGMEMTYLATKHPERLEKLVFLDALYDYIDSDNELFASNPVRVATAPPESFESVDAYCEDFVTRYPAYKPLRSPRWDALWSLSLTQREDGRLVEAIRAETAKQLFQGVGDYHADLAAIECPVLAFFAYQPADWVMPDDASDELRRQVIDYTERMHREFKDRNVERVKTEIADVNVIVYEDTSHYCFLDREEGVVAVMQGFFA